jgi:hypothetical protein
MLVGAQFDLLERREPEPDPSAAMRQNDASPLAPDLRWQPAKPAADALCLIVEEQIEGLRLHFGFSM